jgi:hypothetical protein
VFCFDKHSGYVGSIQLAGGISVTFDARFRYGGYSSAGWGHGVRNIVFPSADPTSGLATWIRFEDGHTRARVTLDSSYGR